jgi:hypothetical protein
MIVTECGTRRGAAAVSPASRVCNGLKRTAFSAQAKMNCVVWLALERNQSECVLLKFVRGRRSLMVAPT